MEFSVSTKISVWKYAILLVGKYKHYSTINSLFRSPLTDFSPQKADQHQACSSNIRSIDLSCQLPFLGIQTEDSNAQKWCGPNSGLQKCLLFRERSKWGLINRLSFFGKSGLCLEGKLWGGANCFNFWVVIFWKNCNRLPQRCFSFLFWRGS